MIVIETRFPRRSAGPWPNALPAIDSEDALWGDSPERLWVRVCTQNSGRRGCCPGSGQLGHWEQREPATDKHHHHGQSHYLCSPPRTDGQQMGLADRSAVSDCSQA